MRKTFMNTTRVLYGLLAMAVLNLAFFFKVLIFSHQAWYVALLPLNAIKILFFYSPIFFTAASLGVFFFEFIKTKRWNWFCFFVTAVGYLPIVISLVASILYNSAHY